MSDNQKEQDQEQNIDNEVNENDNPFSEENFDKEEQVEEAESEQPEENTDKVQQELDSIKNQYVRLAADFDNYRKRQAQERESLLKYGAEDTLKKLLPVMDTFDRAISSLNDVNEVEKLKESFEVVNKQFADALEKVGLQKIETVGEEFDPNLHEAVMQTPTNDHPDHSVIAEMQSGYKLGDRVLRAALVNVAVSE